VGTITVDSNTASISPDSANINWDWNYGGTNNASGSLSGIKVTATVEPILNLELSDTLIALGVISGTGASGSIYLEVGTNSANWVVVTATSSWGGLVHTTDATADLINAANWGNYNYSSADGGWAEIAAATFLSTAQEISTSVKKATIYTTNAPEVSSSTIDDIKFTVFAKAQSSATAGNYEDFITFTITASF
jgi:hypothetical protein